MSFQLTDAGRAAMADSANRRFNQVVFTHMAIGDGLTVPGVDDGGRAALRNERLRQGLAAVTGGVARVGVRAGFSGGDGDPVWKATELGLIAQVGAGPAFLAAYGAVGADDPYAVIAPGVQATIAATVDVVVSGADVAVMVTPNVTVAGASTFSSLLDTPGALARLAYYRTNAGGTALVAVTAAQVLSDLLSGLAAGSYLRVAVNGGVRSLKGLTAKQLAAVFTRSWSPATNVTLAAGAVAILPNAPSVPAGWRVVVVASFDLAGGGSLRVLLGSRLLANVLVSTTSGQFGQTFTVPPPGGQLTLEARSGAGSRLRADRTYLLAAPV